MTTRMKTRFNLTFALIFLATAIAQTATGQPRQTVDLELVLAIDTSTSVDDSEFELQWRGLELAFQHPDVINAIKSTGDLGIAVTLVQWSGEGQHQTAVPWTHISDAQSASRFSAKIRAVPRQMQGFTDIGGAIRYSSELFAGNGFDGLRRVIDVSGDGTSSTGSPAPQRDAAVQRGIVINGLVIIQFDYDLGELDREDLRQHYLNQVIGGPGAFLIIVSAFEDFAEAIRKKLVREINGPLFSGSTSEQRQTAGINSTP